jgi:hypothetical protein
MLLINPSLYKCYNYLIYINVLCASSVHPKGVNGEWYCMYYVHPIVSSCTLRYCMYYVHPIVSSCTLWYWMYYVHPHCILMYPMVLNLLCVSSLYPNVPYGIECIMYIRLYPDVPYGIACTMCRGGIVFHDFGAAHDVCLDPLVPARGFHAWTN